MMSGLQDGNYHNLPVLVQDGVKNFETFFMQQKLNQRLFIRLCDTCAPTLKARLIALSKDEITPGQLPACR